MDKQIKLATFKYPYDMDIVKTKLESDGVQCFPCDENTAFGFVFSDGIRLFILESDLQKALSIIKSSNIQINEATEFDTSELNEKFITDYSPDNLILCPRCKSEKITPYGLKEKLFAISKMFFGYPKIIRTWTFFCFNCNTECKLNK